MDASDGSATQELSDQIRADLRFPVRYLQARLRSSAVQRNDGARASIGELILFLDDDVVLEPDYIAEINAVFDGDTSLRIGGVNGTIINQKYTPPSLLNRLLLGACLGEVPGPGALAGPAVNMLPSDMAGGSQSVQWLSSTGVAYRRDVFLANLFPEFEGYSFMEDVHLSARVARSHQIVNATRARLLHEDLGKSTHADWYAHGKAMVVNRHAVMVEALRKEGFSNHLRLACFELVYCTLSSLKAARNFEGLHKATRMFCGRIAGFVQILRRAGTNSVAASPAGSAGQSLT